MSESLFHPALEELIDLSFGDLAEESATKIREHLKSCSFCNERFEDIAYSLEPGEEEGAKSLPSLADILEIGKSFIKSFEFTLPDFSPQTSEIPTLGVKFRDEKNQKTIKPNKLQAGSFYEVSVKLKEDFYILAALELPGDKVKIIYPYDPDDQTIVKVNRTRVINVAMPNIKGNAFCDVFQLKTELKFPSETRELGRYDFLKLLASQTIGKNQKDWSHDRIPIVIN